jgi:hypothetical protein
MGIFRNNIDVMHQSIQRQSGGIPERVDPSKILMIWEDITIAPTVPRPIRNTTLPNCLSISIQLGLSWYLAGGGGLGPNFFEVPILAVRDGGIDPGASIAALNGKELVPGQSLEFSIIDECHSGRMVFLDPTQLWIRLINRPLVLGLTPSGFGQRIHIGYGILS